MNKFVFVDAFSGFLLNIKCEGSDYIALNVRPGVRYEPEPIKLRLFNEILKIVRVLVKEDEFLPLLLYFLFGNRLHVLKLFLTQNDKSDWF